MTQANLPAKAGILPASQPQVILGHMCFTCGNCGLPVNAGNFARGAVYLRLTQAILPASFLHCTANGLFPQPFSSSHFQNCKFVKILNFTLLLKSNRTTEEK